MHLETILLTVVINTTAGTESPLIFFSATHFDVPTTIHQFTVVKRHRGMSLQHTDIEAHAGTRSFTSTVQYYKVR